MHFFGSTFFVDDLYADTRNIRSRTELDAIEVCISLIEILEKPAASHWFVIRKKTTIMHVF